MHGNTFSEHIDLYFRPVINKVECQVPKATVIHYCKISFTPIFIKIISDFRFTEKSILKHSNETDNGHSRTTDDVHDLKMYTSAPTSWSNLKQ